MRLQARRDQNQSQGASEKILYMLQQTVHLQVKASSEHANRKKQWILALLMPWPVEVWIYLNPVNVAIY